MTYLDLPLLVTCLGQPAPLTIGVMMHFRELCALSEKMSQPSSASDKKSLDEKKQNSRSLGSFSARKERAHGTCARRYDHGP